MSIENMSGGGSSTHVCPWQHVRLFDNILRPLIHRPGKVFGPFVEPGMTVLDVGCGAGFSSLAMARLVGREGRVIAVDLQSEMLEMVRRRAQQAGLADRIELHRCERDRLGLADGVDFAVAFWMLHEVPDQKAFLVELHALLRPGGALLLVEPLGHVSRDAFRRQQDLARDSGFEVEAAPFVLFSRAAVLRKPGQVTP